MVTEDCGCRVPKGYVKVQRVAGGFAAGSWGSVQEGGWAIVPRSLVDAYPQYWQVKDAEQPAGAPDSHAGSPDGLNALTVPELRAKAAEAGVELPAKARKTEIVEALTNGG